MFPLTKTKQPLSQYMINQSNHWDIQLRADEAAYMKQLWADLVASGATLDGGRLVKSKADVIKWIAQQYRQMLK